MRADMLLGGEAAFTLRDAILVYSDGHQTFATRHEPIASDVGAPTLGPGQLVSTGFLKELAKGLGASVPAEVLPPQVLCRTADVTVWWRPASRAPMFFNLAKDAQDRATLMKLSGKTVPHPALVFRATATQLWVRALLTSERPTATTRLMMAPYYNVSTTGAVCVGSMRRPATRALDSILEWEQSFFASEFTHPLPSARLTRYRGGFAAMWQDLAKRRRGPIDWSRYLIAPKKAQLLRDFVTEEDRGQW